MSFKGVVEKITNWCQANFTFTGLGALILAVYCLIPDYYSRNEFWKSKLPFLKDFIFAHSRLLLISVAILLIWLDHRRVLAGRRRAGKSGLQLAIETVWYEYKEDLGQTVFVIAVYLLNSGEPTVALNWRAEYKLNDTVEKMTGFYITDTYVLRRGDETLTLTNDDLIIAKVLTNQIARGDARSGRLLFTLPGDRTEQVRSLQLRISVMCSDYAGNTAVAHFIPDPKPMDYIKFFPGEKLTKKKKQEALPEAQSPVIDIEK